MRLDNVRVRGGEQLVLLTTDGNSYGTVWTVDRIERDADGRRSTVVLKHDHIGICTRRAHNNADGSVTLPRARLEVTDAL